MKILYTTSEGKVCIVNHVPKERVEEILGTLTDEEHKEHIYDVSIPKDAQNVTEISDDMIPVSREFRDAWVWRAGKIELDEIKVDEIKASRAPK